ETVLVDLDVRADVGRAVPASPRKVLVGMLRAAAVVVAGLPELKRSEAGDEPLLLVVHLVVDSQPAAGGLLDSRDASAAPHEGERHRQGNDREEDPKESFHPPLPFFCLDAADPRLGGGGIVSSRRGMQMVVTT